MSESGLAASIDKYGTVIGRNPEVTRAVLMGSHSDTVPNGGWLDGSLGVIYGLEIARCFAEQGTSAVGADAISFQDEEGTFLALMGSRAFCGEDIAAEIASAKDKGGTALTEAIAKSGFGPSDTLRLEPARHVAYLESHIERALASNVLANVSASSAPSSVSEPSDSDSRAKPTTPARHR